MHVVACRPRLAYPDEGSIEDSFGKEYMEEGYAGMGFDREVSVRRRHISMPRYPHQFLKKKKLLGMSAHMLDYGVRVDESESVVGEGKRCSECRLSISDVRISFRECAPILQSHGGDPRGEGIVFFKLIIREGVLSRIYSDIEQGGFRCGMHQIEKLPEFLLARPGGNGIGDAFDETRHRYCGIASSLLECHESE